jgi:hypothetical protein
MLDLGPRNAPGISNLSADNPLSSQLGQNPPVRLSERFAHLHHGKPLTIPLLSPAKRVFESSDVAFRSHWQRALHLG